MAGVGRCQRHRQDRQSQHRHGRPAADVHAKDLIAKKVEINVAGHGDIETSPQDSADISIAGPGNVKLYSRTQAYRHVDPGPGRYRTPGADKG